MAESPLEWKIKSAGIYLTRRCNNDCAWCGVIRSKKEELLPNQWEQAIRIASGIGVETIKILGGEPTLYEGLPRIVSFLRHETNIEFTLVSNLLIRDAHLSELIDSGLTCISTSIDTLGFDSVNRGSERKSKVALRKLGIITARNVRVIVNIVVNRSNFEKLPEMVKFFSDQGVYVHLIPYHFGDTNTWIARSGDREPAVDLSQLDRLSGVVDLLLEQKQSGALIQEDVSYLNEMKRRLVSLDWHCGRQRRPSLLRVDSDGLLMACSDYVGKKSSSYSIFQLSDSAKYQRWLSDWYDDVKTCAGCFWPDMYHSELEGNLSVTKDLFKKGNVFGC